ncbi:MAG: GNAT family N-acetyltransferase [Acidobacteriia bacterium]|nr:GNAT family N-acetyltransferase [Terriglobia bacterium]
MNPPKLTFCPLTPERWPDLETLFGARGACGGCWCMTWRLSRAEFNRKKGAGNKRALKKLASAKIAPGVLAYVGKEPAGWCAVAPREQYPALDRSRVLAPVDDQPVWSVSCFFVAKAFRRQGITAELLRAAVKYAKKNGAKIVEGYPNDLGKGALPDAFVWTGLLPTFTKAGFREVVRRSAKRPILRISV